MNSKNHEDRVWILELEIESQLQRDILSCSWLISITKRLFREMDFEQRANILVAAISNLAERVSIDIGPSKTNSDSEMYIESWADTPETKVKKLREFIEQHGPPNYETNFAFWVGLPSKSSQ